MIYRGTNMVFVDMYHSIACFWQLLCHFLACAKNLERYSVLVIIIIIVLQILDMQYGILKGDCACHMYYGTTMVSESYHCSTMLFFD